MTASVIASDPRVKPGGKQSMRTQGGLRPVDCFVAAHLAHDGARVRSRKHDR